MNILVISSNLIGDNILSTGVIEHFLNQNKDSRFTFIVGPSASQLYKNFPNLEKAISIKKKKFNLHWFIIWKSCFFKKWDIIIDFRSSLLSYILFHKKKYIFKNSEKKHKLQQLSDFFNIKIPHPFIYNSDTEITMAKKFFFNKYKYIAISPGGNWMPKIWPVDKFNELIVSLNKNYNDLYFVLIGSSNENEQYFEKITNGINNKCFINLMGESLTNTAAYLKCCNLFIGNDSGMMHLAVASKIPTIGLFGPTNDNIYSPFGNNSFTIRTKETYSDFNKLSLNRNLSYMHSIEVRDILNLIHNKNLL